MIIKLGNNWARSENYEIKGKNKDTFTYLSNDKVITIDWEAGYEPYNRMIYSSLIKKWDSPEGLTHTPQEKAEIKNNCKEGWTFLGVPVVFDD